MVETSDILIFDRNRLRHNRKRCAAKLKEHDFLLNWVNTQLLESLSNIKKDFPLTLQLGSKNDSKTLHASQKIKDVIHIDLTADIMTPDTLRVIADEEMLPFTENSFDLVISNLDLHSVNDLPNTLIQINHILKPDGLFLAALLGGKTLCELRESLIQTELSLKGGASPRIFPFADKQQMSGLLQHAGFALPVVDSDVVTVTYEDMFKLMHDLRGMGEGNIIQKRNKINPGKQFFIDAAGYYHEHFSEKDGRLPASFEIIFLIGWAPHKSQQQPLKPGSADISLHEALEKTQKN